MKTRLVDNFISQFRGLIAVVQASEQRVIADQPDVLFYENQNIFIKSYLVSACSILEAFVQDLALASVNLMQDKINALNVPTNFVNWLANNDKQKTVFAVFTGSKVRKDISDLSSPSYYKTLSVFERIGIDINVDAVSSFKDFVSSIVNKRNKVVHHNDSASDLSFSDVVQIINQFEKYSENLYSAVCQNMHVATDL